LLTFEERLREKITFCGKFTPCTKGQDKMQGRNSNWEFWAD